MFFFTESPLDKSCLKKRCPACVICDNATCNGDVLPVMFPDMEWKVSACRVFDDRVAPYEDFKEQRETIDTFHLSVKKTDLSGGEYLPGTNIVERGWHDTDMPSSREILYLIWETA